MTSPSGPSSRAARRFHSRGTDPVEHRGAGGDLVQRERRDALEDVQGASQARRR